MVRPILFSVSAVSVALLLAGFARPGFGQLCPDTPQGQACYQEQCCCVPRGTPSCPASCNCCCLDPPPPSPPPSPPECLSISSQFFTLRHAASSCKLSSCQQSCLQGFFYSQDSTCRAAIAMTRYDIGDCSCYSASGTAHFLSFTGGDISGIKLDWQEGFVGDTNVDVTPVDNSQCTLQYMPSSPAPTSPNAPVPQSENDGQYYAKVLSSMVGTAIAGIIVGSCMTIPKAMKDKWYRATDAKLDPSAGIGILVVILMIATVSTTDTITIVQEFDGSRQIQVGIFRAEYKLNGLSLSTTYDCGTIRDDYLRDCVTPCCKKLFLYCYLLKALSVCGLLCSVAAVAASFIKSFNAKISSRFALCAAVNYYVVIVIFIDLVLGSSNSNSSTCGLATSGMPVRLSAGFGLLVVSFVLSVSQLTTVVSATSVNTATTNGDDDALLMLPSEREEGRAVSDVHRQPATYEDDNGAV